MMMNNNYVSDNFATALESARRVLAGTWTSPAGDEHMDVLGKASVEFIFHTDKYWYACQFLRSNIPDELPTGYYLYVRKEGHWRQVDYLTCIWNKSMAWTVVRDIAAKYESGTLRRKEIMI